MSEFHIPKISSTESLPDTAHPLPKDFYVNILPNEVVILSVNKLKRTFLLHVMLELTMMNSKVINNEQHFFSVTSTDDELSLITEKQLLDEAIKTNKISTYDDYHSSCETYRVLQFHECGSGITHTGIVQYLSKLFSTENIPIIYINTYNNNFIIITSSNFDKCNRLLKKYNYVL